MEGGLAMDSRWRIEPAEEARHQEVMAGLGVHGAEWALRKPEGAGGVRLSTRGIPKLFPKLEELDGDGLNAKRTVPFKKGLRDSAPTPFILLDTEGREKELRLRYLNSNKAYWVFGSEWRRFVKDSGMCKGDRLDLSACRRGDGERCLFTFTSKGGGASGGNAAWCTNGRKRARQPAAAAAAVRNHKRRGKSCRAEREVPMPNVMDDGMHGGFQGYYGCCKATERTREGKAPPRSWIGYATEKEREAAKGLLMLKYAILAKYYY
ncbi:hypothetical protein ACQ4PT_023726 [Festuca glaucescens]